jgi:glutathione S-transferase
MYDLHFYPGNASLAPHLVLQELAVPFRLILVDREREQQKSEEYRRLNPLCRIPTLVDDGLVLSEAAAICLYVAERSSPPRLLGDGSATARAALLQWLTFLTNTLQPALMAWHYPERWTLDAAHHDAVRARAAANVTTYFEHVEQQLNRSSFLTGEQLTICEFYLWMLARWARKMETSARSFARCSALLELISQRASVRAVVERERLEAPLF